MRENQTDIGSRDEKGFRSRTFPAQVKGVDHENGAITCVIVGQHEQYTVDIPLQGLSVNGLKSSWQRAMPQVKDYVEIAFDIRNRAYAVRMLSWRFNADSGGYEDVTKAAKANPTALGLIWRTLQQGEYDLRSAGGAGYYFTRDGHATVLAGPTKIDLDKNRNEGVSQGGLWVWKGDNYEVRFGDVKRMLLPTDFAESAVVPNPAGAAVAREWHVKIGASTPVPGGLPKMTYYEEQAGDVRDDTGLPVLGPAGLPLRYFKETKDASGLLSTFRVEIDAVGNMKVTQAATAAAGGIKIDMGATNPFSMNALSVNVSATTTADIGGTAGVNINAGGAADSVMVRGTELALYFASKLSVPTAFGPSGPALVPLVPGTELSILAKVK